MVAVLASDHRGHILAVTPLELGGQLGLAVIDLSDDDIYFMPPPGQGNSLRN